MSWCRRTDFVSLLRQGIAAGTLLFSFRWQSTGWYTIIFNRLFAKINNLFLKCATNSLVLPIKPWSEHAILFHPPALDSSLQSHWGYYLFGLWLPLMQVAALMPRRYKFTHEKPSRICGRIFEKCIHDVSWKREICPYAPAVYNLKALTDDIEAIFGPL